MTDAPSPIDPADLDDVSLDRDDERWTLVMIRRLRHDPDRVWSALVDPTQLAEWAPFDAPRDLSTTGPVILTMATPDGTAGDSLASEVLEVEATVRLVYRWGDDLLRWDLALDGDTGGTILTLHHTIDDPEWVAQTAAGWHLCLDVAERSLDGGTGGRIVGEAAMDHGWEALRDGYAERLSR
jgi:uncharacterized protein YndB with AHSA1/START domain